MKLRNDLAIHPTSTASESSDATTKPPKRGARRGRSQRQSSARRRRLAVQLLERRDVLATVTWDGGAGTTLWSDGDNWDTNNTPAFGDDVIIGNVGATINADTSIDIASIDTQSRISVNLTSFRVDSGNFAAGFDVTASDAVDLGNSTINGGTWTNFEVDGQIINIGNLTLNALTFNPNLPNQAGSITNAGSLLITGENLVGDFVNPATSTMTIQATGNLGGSIVNRGTLISDQPTTLNLTASLDNTGTFRVQSGLTILAGAVAQRLGRTLTVGTWEVINGSELDFASGPSIDSIGPAANVLMRDSGKFDPIRSVSAIDGSLRLVNQFFLGLATQTPVVTGSLVVDGSSYSQSVAIAMDVAGGTVELVNLGFISSQVDLLSGRFGGSGSVSGFQFRNLGGIVSPGNSPGDLQIFGDYIQGPDGTLEIEVEGAAIGQFDRLLVSGNASLDGTLNVLLPTSFLVDRSELLTFITTGGTLSGNFANTSIPSLNSVALLQPSLQIAQANLLGTSLVVRNTNDSGPFSLRAKIEEANTIYTQDDRIYFQIPGAGIQSIETLSELPFIGTPVILDATTQSGTLGVAPPAPLVELHPDALSVGLGNGLRVLGGSTTIRGIAIYDYNVGISLETPNHVVESNYIGIDASGNPGGNDRSGLYLQDAGNSRIGGPTPSQRNVISGNGDGAIPFAGIEFSGLSSDGTTIEGNYIGVGPDGLTAIPNSSGVMIGVSNNITIGGTSPGQGNTISGNIAAGINIGAGLGVPDLTDDNLIVGNLIGLDATGSVAVPNNTGITIVDTADNNQIGDGTIGGRNTISGNQIAGISINTLPGASNRIQGNFIGTDSSGLSSVGTSGDGVYILGGAHLIGGLTLVPGTGLGNVISGHSGAGIELVLATSNGNAIAGNIIGLDRNGQLAIPNAAVGILSSFGSSGHTIGGLNPLARNVISGNGSGIVFDTADSGSNLIVNNYIGTDLSGTQPRPNASDGIRAASSNNIIGASTAGNLISGNTSAGVVIRGSSADNNFIQANLIGTDRSGLLPLPNQTGILIEADAISTQIGGSTLFGDGNTISGNSQSGIEIVGPATDSTEIFGNTIGLGLDGDTPIANGTGILVDGTIGITAIGGPFPQSRNTISSNTTFGVFIRDASATQVQGNYIGTDREGRRARGNAVGIYSRGGPMPTIGGVNPGEGNLISGNSNGQLAIGPGTSGGTIAGNLVGTDFAGLSPLAGGTIGIETTTVSSFESGGLPGAPRTNVQIIDNTIGGLPANIGLIAGADSYLLQSNRIGVGVDDQTPLGGGIGIDVASDGTVIGQPALGNTIGAHTNMGISLQNGVSGSLIQANAIGTDRTASIALGNSVAGIIDQSNDTSNIIGGSLVGQPNTIAYNGTGLLSNQFRGGFNQYFANALLAIDVPAAGVTLNDSPNVDGQVGMGIVTNTSLDTNSLTIEGFAPEAGRVLQFYVSSASLTGYGQGKTFIAAAQEGSVSDQLATTGNYGPNINGLPVTTAGGLTNQPQYRFVFPLSSIPDEARAQLNLGTPITALAIDSLSVLAPNGAMGEFGPNAILGDTALLGDNGSARIFLPPTFAVNNDGRLLLDTGYFIDTDSSSWSLSVDYGDGSPIRTLAYERLVDESAASSEDGYGSEISRYRFALDHTYTQSRPTSNPFVVRLRLNDDRNRQSSTTMLVTVDNNAPAIDLSKVRIAPPIFEGQSVTLRGILEDGNAGQSLEVEIDWGDGSPTSIVTPNAQREFVGTHTYLDDGASQTSIDQYTIQVFTRDSQTLQTITPIGRITQEVRNRLPNELTVLPLPPAPIQEGNLFSLPISFSDAGVLDHHRLIVDWGDGTLPQSYAIPANTPPSILRTPTLSLQPQHRYLSASPPGGFNVRVQLSDDDQPQSFAIATTVVNVLPVGPTIQVNQAQFNPEGASSTVAGQILDANDVGGHRLWIDWNDGTPAIPYAVSADGSFAAAYVYRDNGLFKPTLRAQRLADPNRFTVVELSAAVANVAPTITTLQLSQPVVVEGETFTVTGTFTDPSIEDSHTVSIQWGDGTSSFAIVDSLTRTFTASHQLADDLPSNSPTDLATLSVIVVDDDQGTATSSRNFTAQNVRPTIARVEPISTVGGTVQFQATIIDPATNTSVGSQIPNERFTYHWSLDDGTPLGSYTGSNRTHLSNSLPALSNGRTLILRVNDDDDATVSEFRAKLVIGTAGSDTITVSNSDATAGIPTIVLGLGGNDIINASQLDATKSAYLFGGPGSDRLYGGAGADVYFMEDGDDVANVATLAIPGTASMVNFGGDDTYYVNFSTQTIQDPTGSNTLSFERTSLLDEFGDPIGVTFDLNQVPLTGPLGTIDVAPQQPNTHRLVIGGQFGTIVGSPQADVLTAASGATLEGGAGGDTYKLPTTATTNITLRDASRSDAEATSVLIPQGSSNTNLSITGSGAPIAISNAGQWWGGTIRDGSGTGAGGVTFTNHPTGTIPRPLVISGRGDEGIRFDNFGVIGASDQVAPVLSIIGDGSGTGAGGITFTNQPGGTVRSPIKISGRGDFGAIDFRNDGLMELPGATPIVTITRDGSGTGAGGVTFINGGSGTTKNPIVISGRGDTGSIYFQNDGLLQQPGSAPIVQITRDGSGAGAGGITFINGRGGTTKSPIVISGRGDAGNYYFQNAGTLEWDLTDTLVTIQRDGSGTGAGGVTFVNSGSIKSPIRISGRGDFGSELRFENSGVIGGSNFAATIVSIENDGSGTGAGGITFVNQPTGTIKSPIRISGRGDGGTRFDNVGQIGQSDIQQTIVEVTFDGSGTGAGGVTFVNQPTGKVKSPIVISGRGDGDVLLSNLGDIGTIGQANTIVRIQHDGSGSGAGGITFVNRPTGTIRQPITISGRGDLDIDNQGSIRDGLSSSSPVLLHASAQGRLLLSNQGELQRIVVQGGNSLAIIQNGDEASFHPTIDDATLASGIGGIAVTNFATLRNNVIVEGNIADDAVYSGPNSIVQSLLFRGREGSDQATIQGSFESIVVDAGTDLLRNTLLLGGDPNAADSNPHATVAFTGSGVLENYFKHLASVTFTGANGDDYLINHADGVRQLNFLTGGGNNVMTNLGSVASIRFDSQSASQLPQPIPIGQPLPIHLLVNRGAGSVDQNTVQPATLQFVSGPGINILNNLATATGFAVDMIGNSGPDLLYNEAPALPKIEFQSGGSPDRGTWQFPVGDVLHNVGDSVSKIDYRAPNDSSPDWLLNAGRDVTNVTMTAGFGFNLLENAGSAVSGFNLQGTNLPSGASPPSPPQVLSGTAPDYGPLPDHVNALVHRGIGAKEFTLHGGHGLTSIEVDGDGFRESSLASGNEGIQFLTTRKATGLHAVAIVGSPSADFIRNEAPAASALNISLVGGADYFENRAANTRSSTFSLGDDSDYFANFGRSLTDVTIDAGSGDDTIELIGSGATNVRTFGGFGNDRWRSYSLAASSLLFDGGDGDDVAIQFAHDIAALDVIGGPGNDVVVNYGNNAQSILLDGGSGDDELIQFGHQGGAVELKGGPDQDRLYVVRSNLRTIRFDGGDGMDDVDIDGGTVATVDIISGSGNDAARLTTTITGAIRYWGQSGDDYLDLAGTIDGTAPLTDFNPNGLTRYDLQLGDGNDVLVMGGALPTAAPLVNVSMGTGNDRIVVLPSLQGNPTIDGGLGSDTYLLSDAPAFLRVVDDGPLDSSIDTLDFSSFRNSAVTVDLASTAQQPLGPLTLQLTSNQSIENVVGTAGADVIRGNSRDNAIWGASYFATPPATPALSSGTQWVLFDFDTYTNSAAEDALLPREVVIDDEHQYSEEQRDEILDQFHRYYRGPRGLAEGSPWFDVRATYNAIDIPQSESYITVDINRLPSNQQPGGEASEIDLGNRNKGGSAVVQVSGMLGGEFAPDATIENFVRLTAKIAAHEVAHLLGLWHGDAVGPIGFGGHLPLNPSLGFPAFADVPAAFETNAHVLSSPASLGSSRFSDLGDLYFSERESIKLAAAFTDGNTISATESTTPSTSSQPQSVPLRAIRVPNALQPTAFNYNKSFDVNARLIDGAIDLHPTTGTSRADYYQFQLEAGQVFNAEAASTTIATATYPSEAFLNQTVNTVLILRDSTGNIVAFNSDSFESPDAKLDDVRIATSGLYTLEVAALMLDGTAPEGVDPFFAAAYAKNDTGSYRVLVSTFRSANGNDGIDTLEGRAGVDRLDGGPGESYLPSIPSLPDATANEGQPWALAVPFVDPAGIAWTATIDYGDGSSTNWIGSNKSIPLAHTYADNGTYNVVVGLRNDDGLQTTWTIRVVVGNVSPSVTGPSGPASGPVGTPVRWSVAATDVPADPLTYTWTVRNGSADIPFTPVAGSNGQQIDFNPTLSGPYTISVVVQDGDGGSVTKSGTFNATGSGPSYGIVAGPANIAGNSLRIVGTNNNDVLILLPVPGVANRFILATATSLSSQTRTTLATITAAVTSVQIDALDGNDAVWSLVNLPSFVFGGRGNDTLLGGPNRNALIGGDGNDTITGNTNRDILFGGLGADTLLGGSGEDLLVAGQVTHETSIEALDAILAEWSSTSTTYANRVKNLTNVTPAASRKNRNFFLTSATITDDNLSDSLTGQAGTDWYLLNLNALEAASRRDRVEDLASGERRDDLG
jgi:hypothetical protein